MDLLIQKTLKVKSSVTKRDNAYSVPRLTISIEKQIDFEMKIFSTAPEGNEMAELENARYINLALKQIDENIEWLKTANKPTQAVLIHIDILVMLAKRFTVDANLLIKKRKFRNGRMFLTIGLSVVAVKFLLNLEMALKQMEMSFLMS